VAYALGESEYLFVKQEKNEVVRPRAETDTYDSKMQQRQLARICPGFRRVCLLGSGFLMRLRFCLNKSSGSLI
jgi:hypothetical protein